MQATSPSNPTVTVVTAVYNLCKGGRADKFRQCVESVHAQTYAGIEHLVIDGASDDGTRELVAEYEAKGWLRCFSEPDSGIYDAMNKGLARAQGKYVVYLNSDDFWHDARAVETSVRFLEESGADFSYAPYTMVREDGTPCGTHRPNLGAFIWNMPCGHPTMFCRVDMLRQFGGFDQEHYRIIADYDLLTRLLLGGRLGVYVPLSFVSFRMGGVSHQDAADTRLREHCTLYRLRYAPLLGVEDGCPLSMQNLPESLIPALAGRLHPAVFAMLCRTVPPPAPVAGMQLVPPHHSVTKWKGPLSLPLLTKVVEPGGGARRWKLFGCLPLLACERCSKDGSLKVKESYKLLGVPVWKVTTSPGTSRKHHLFGFIPMFSEKRG